VNAFLPDILLGDITMKMRCVIFVLALALIPALQAAAVETPSTYLRLGNWQVHGDSPHYLAFGLGAFDIDEEPVGAARVELRFGRKLFFVGPAVGLLANTDGGYFGYAGIYADISYKNLVITPMAAGGGYEEGEGIDLGGIFQFQATLTLAYQFDNLSRLGVRLGHLSNGGTHDSNPSEQDAFVTFAIPF
jgi:opacity protein-like surface antigen